MPDFEFVEDTGLITYAQATKLWEKHLPRFIEATESEYDSAEMGIWTGCKDTTDYHTCSVHADKDTKIINGRLFQIIEQEVKP